MSSVLVSVPNTGWVHKYVAAALLKVVSQTCGHALEVIQPTHRPYENNLHHIAKQFVENHYDYWLSFDADNPPMRNPLELVALDLDLVGCPTPVWHYEEHPGERPIYWNAYRYLPDQDSYTEWSAQDGLQEVDAIGSGCFLVSRRVMVHEMLRFAPFQRVYHADGRVERGCDIAFCERVKTAGFRVWAHFGYPCHHFCELDLCEVIRAHQLSHG